MALMKNMSVSAVLLGLFAIVGTALVAYTYSATKDRIAANERAILLRTLHTLIPASEQDNDMAQDTVQVTSPQYLGSPKPMTVYRARKHGKPVAAVFTAIAPNGYGGPIKLLVAVRYDGTIAGVRVISDQETPGLGDAIESEKSDWIYSFTGKSLDNPGKKGWAVKRDGGQFDQFTGATISPRAVVKAVHNTLLYFKQHREELFGAKPTSDKTGGEHTNASEGPSDE
ncbi:MAG TPA: electron transport complex subunit RsxG [Gammaproteobacteria bacterium]|nr:electron transport complex subunit RsxG [Gammaproteobacteria bacterium]